MNTFLANLFYNFLIAFGVIIGASLFAGLGSLFINTPPMKTILDVGKSIKIWAVAVALGGTFSSFQIIEQGLFNGEIKSLIKQITYILAALIGANLGYSLLKLIQRCGEAWMD